MVTTVDINLTRSHLAVFPDLCVVCGAEYPQSQVRWITGTLGWWTWLMIGFGRPFAVVAPACSGCAWSLQARKGLGLVTCLLIGLVAALWLWPLVEAFVPGGVQRWVLGLLFVGCVWPLVEIESLFAPPFNVKAWANRVDYEFRSKEHALKFAAINLDAEWVEVDGLDYNSYLRYVDAMKLLAEAGTKDAADRGEDSA